ncbi:MAG: hypothetical protein K6B64_01115 [Acholeplasmatales bacterium]|nr:hypothetical protein [Acholeplasmatales bacterium]
MKKKYFLLGIIFMLFFTLVSCASKNNGIYKSFAGDDETGRVFLTSRIQFYNKMDKPFEMEMNYGRSEILTFDTEYSIYYDNGTTSGLVYDCDKTFGTSIDYVVKQEYPVEFAEGTTLFFFFKKDDFKISLDNTKEIFDKPSGTITLYLAPTGSSLADKETNKYIATIEFSYEVSNNDLTITDYFNK